jgi:hypothetical protein
MKILYDFVVWGDSMTLAYMYSKLKDEYPIYFRMKRVDSLKELNSRFFSRKRKDPSSCIDVSLDFIYLGINRHNMDSFIREVTEVKRYRDSFFELFAFFSIDSSVENNEDKQYIVENIEKLFERSQVGISYSSEYELFSFEFIRFLLSLPRKRVLLPNGKTVNVDFYQKVISVSDSDRTYNLSNAESHILKQLFISWEENKRYVTEIKLRNISKKESLPVLLSRLRKKILLLSELVNTELFSIKKSRRYGYFLEDKGV